MRALPAKTERPESIVSDTRLFVPRIVLTPALQQVVAEVIHQWRVRDRFDGLAKYGIRPLDRLLFYGPPGNGKTIGSHWIASQLGVPIYRVLCNQLHGETLGATTKAVSEACSWLNAQTEPCVCLWDEVEAIFVDRSISAGQCDREIAAALTMFMQAIDRWTAPTLLILATNLPDQLDAALLSRVELRAEFAAPDEQQSIELLNYWRELLHRHGADDWGPAIHGRLKSGWLPASFRELQQTIARAARKWTARSPREEAASA